VTGIRLAARPAKPTAPRKNGMILPVTMRGHYSS
jgi:hypothetical protein